MSSGCTRRVAIVDDDDGVARACALMLRGLGYEAVLFGDPETAVAELPRTNVDLIVMDVGLGGTLSGFEVARRLAGKIDVPVLFLTGMVEIDVPDLAGSGATYAFLPKPVRRAVIHTTVRLLEMQHESRKKVAELGSLLAESQRLARIGSFRIDGDRVRWTDMMYELHGVSPDSFVPTCEGFLELLAPVERASFEQLGVDGSRLAFEYRVVIGDSERRMRGNAERNQGAIVGTVQDVTESERAVEANRAKTEFLANMSHELRTPLNAVLGLSEAMLEGTFGAISPVQRNVLGTVHASGSHLLELINDVLDVSRVELGNLTITPAPVALRHLVEEIAELLAPQLAGKNQRLVVDIAPALPALEVDPRRFKQVLLNIVGNAGKFSPEDSQITLSASTNASRRQLAIAIADQGPGIAEVDRNRVFQPFVTLDPSMTRTHGGVGLGLSLAKRIVELHGGEIAVSGPPAGGTVFSITLPLTDTMLVPSAGDPVRSVPAMDGLVVLVVEDNEAIAFAMRSYLESLGCTVRTARDGAEALAVTITNDLDAIVMDVQLPEIDGLTVVRKIRARGDQVPIVIATAHAMPGDEAQCLEAGGNAYLPKPVSLRRLAETLESLVRAS